MWDRAGLGGLVRLAMAGGGWRMVFCCCCCWQTQSTQHRARQRLGSSLFFACPPLWATLSVVSRVAASLVILGRLWQQ